MKKAWDSTPGLDSASLRRMVIEEALTNEEIAERLGCGRGTVVSALKEQGLSCTRVQMMRRIAQGRKRRAG
jgi:hypothetical protein